MKHIATDIDIENPNKTNVSEVFQNRTQPPHSCSATELLQADSTRSAAGQTSKQWEITRDPGKQKFAAQMFYKKKAKKQYVAQMY